MLTPKRFRAISVVTVLASAALVLAVTGPAEAAVKHKTGEVLCTGERTGYIEVYTDGATRVQISRTYGLLVGESNYRGNNSPMYFSGHGNQSFDYDVLINPGAGTIHKIIAGCH